MPSSVLLPELRERAQVSFAAMRASFARTGSGLRTVGERAASTEALLRELWLHLLGDRGVALYALGGFGRRELFPYSDIDVLFLCADESAERDAHEPIRTVTQTMWDKAGARARPPAR